MIFANPNYLYLLLLLLPAVAWYLWKQSGAQASLQVPALSAFGKMTASYKKYLRHVNFAILLGAIAMVIVVLARPQSTDNWSKSNTEGIDIMLSLDVSGSMLAADFKPNRVEAAKDVAAQFINGRPTDNIGLVIFAKESFTMCPMTTDQAVLLNLLKDVNTELIDGNATAIGNGLATAINRIKDGQAKSKTIILLTDGTNNSGDVAPVTAAEIAKTFGIRVYTIGVGTIGTAPYPARTPYGQIVYQDMKVDIDEPTLKDIAAITGGKYFRATDKGKLSQIFEEIDQMEKTKISVREYSKKQEEYLPFALAAFALLLIHILLRNTLLRSIP
ncbi:MAG: VWA domain-containing protein [Bacteroidales bacterium]|nr:VWA domain-containing protein [Bacteroidales bacterium]